MEVIHPSHVHFIGGSWLPLVRIAAPAVINSVNYVRYRKQHDEPIQAKGLILAAGTGVFCGGFGQAASLATGASTIGSLVWMPSTTALSMSGNAIARQH